MDYLYLYLINKSEGSENKSENKNEIKKKINYPDFVLYSDFSLKNALENNDKNLLLSLLT